MDQNQKRYAMNRIEAAVTERTAVLRDKHTKKAKVATDAVKIAAIRNGDVELKMYGVTMNTTLADAFSFRGVEGVDVLDQKAFNKDRLELESQAAKVKDEIMLGDGKKAIALIRKFCGE